MDIIIIMLTGFLLFMAEKSLFEHFWHRGLYADIKISPKVAFPGDRCALTATVTNEKIMPLPWLWLKFNVSSSFEFPEIKSSGDALSYYNGLFCIMGRQKIERKMHFIPRKRGYYAIRDLDLIGTSILFNGKSSKHFKGSSTLTVYPESVSAEEVKNIILKTEGLTPLNAFATPDPFEFAGIKEYSYQDSFHDINFRASAHMGRLMSNKHFPTVRGEIALIMCFPESHNKNSYEVKRSEYIISLVAALSDVYTAANYKASVYTNAPDAAEGQPVYIPYGSGDKHIKDIYEALARIDYTYCAPPESLKINERQSSVAVFFSLSADKAVIDLFENIKENYAEAQWYLPVMEFDLKTTASPTPLANLIGVPEVKI